MSTIRSTYLQNLAIKTTFVRITDPTGEVILKIEFNCINILSIHRKCNLTIKTTLGNHWSI